MCHSLDAPLLDSPCPDGVMDVATATSLHLATQQCCMPHPLRPFRLEESSCVHRPPTPRAACGAPLASSPLPRARAASEVQNAPSAAASACCTYCSTLSAGATTGPDAAFNRAVRSSDGATGGASAAPMRSCASRRAVTASCAATAAWRHASSAFCRDATTCGCAVRGVIANYYVSSNLL